MQALTAGAAQAYEKTLAQNGIRCKDGMYAFTGRMSQYSNQDHIFPIRNAQMPDKGELARIDERCKREICYENIKNENPDMSPELARAALAKEISARSKGLPSKVTDAKVPTAQELIEKNPSPNLPVRQEQQSLTRETPDLTASVRSRRSFVQDLHRNAMSTASHVPTADRASTMVKSVEVLNVNSTFRPELNTPQSSAKDLVRSKQEPSVTRVISAPPLVPDSFGPSVGGPGIHVDLPEPNFDDDFQGDMKSQEAKEPKAQEAEAPKRNWSRFSKGMSAGAPSLGNDGPSFDNGFNK